MSEKILRVYFVVVDCLIDNVDVCYCKSYEKAEEKIRELCEGAVCRLMYKIEKRWVYDSEQNYKQIYDK